MLKKHSIKKKPNQAQAGEKPVPVASIMSHIFYYNLKLFWYQYLEHRNMHNKPLQKGYFKPL